MPLYRKLHTKIIDSFDFAEMPDDFCRVFWMLLIVVADSEGRAIDSPSWVRSKMFPLREDVQDGQIERALSWLAGRGMIQRYEAGGRKYFSVCNFKKYQTGTEKEAKSVLPSPEQKDNYSEPTQELVQSNLGAAQEFVFVAASASASEYEYDNARASEKPNIYAIYEKEIGALTPMVSDKLDAAIQDNPDGWIEDAIREAVEHNARNWKYIERILSRWKVEGRGNRNGNRNGKVGRVLVDADGNEVMV